MKKIFSIVDEKKGIMQVTTDDERWYIKEGKDKKTGLPTHIYLPSATWICFYVPKDQGFYEWLKKVGDESEMIKQDRGKYGTRVHKAIEMLLNGEEVAHDLELTDPDSGSLQHLTAEEYQAVISFVDWWKELIAKHEVEIVDVEKTIWNQKLGFAGTVDLVLKIDGETWVIDFKTSKDIYLNHEAQISAYKHALNLGDAKTAILQVGYKRNKKGFKFTEIEDKFHLFQAAKLFWREKNAKVTPNQVELPLKVKLVEDKKEKDGK